MYGCVHYFVAIQGTEKLILHYTKICLYIIGEHHDETVNPISLQPKSFYITRLPRANPSHFNSLFPQCPLVTFKGTGRDHLHIKGAFWQMIVNDIEKQASKCMVVAL